MIALLWILIAGLTASLTLFYYGGQRGIRDSVYLPNLIVVALLDDAAHAKQKALLIEFVRGASYESSSVLSGMVSNGFCTVVAMAAPAPQIVRFCRSQIRTQ